MKQRIELHTESHFSENFSLVDPVTLLDMLASSGCQAVAVTDRHSVASFFGVTNAAKELDIRVIYGVTLDCIDEDDRYAVTVLARTRAGLDNLFRLVTLVHQQGEMMGKHITRKQLEELREGLLVGACAQNGQLARAISLNKDENTLQRIAQSYDYLEVLAEPYDICAETCRLAAEVGIPACAVQDTRVIGPKHGPRWHAYRAFRHYWGQPDTPPITRDSVELEKQYHALYVLPYEADIPQRVLWDGPQQVLDRIEDFSMIGDDLKQNAEEEHCKAMPRLRIMAEDKLREKYGEYVPDYCRDQLSRELKQIDSAHGAKSIEHLIHFSDIVRQEQGAMQLLGTWANSYFLYLTGVTEFNPLPAHVWCPNCGHFELTKESGNCCPICGEVLREDGYDLITEICFTDRAMPLGRFEIRCSQDTLRAISRRNNDSLWGDQVIPMAIEWQEWDGDFTKCQHIMDAYMEAYGGNGNTKNMSADEDFRGLLRFYQNQKWTRDEDMMYTILPQKNAMPVLPIKYDDIGAAEFKLGWRGLKEEDGVTEIVVFQGSIHEALCRCRKKMSSAWNKHFVDADAYGLLQRIFTGEHLSFEHQFFAEYIETQNDDSDRMKKYADRIPVTDMSQLVRLLGARHSTGIAEQFDAGIGPEHILVTREEVYRYLIAHGMDRQTATDITYRVYMGQIQRKGFTAEETELMKIHQIEPWFIDSCRKAGYLFPESYLLFVAKAYAELATYALHEAETVWPIFYDICYEHESKKSLRIRR